MDRNGAFNRYACILKDAENWLTGRYRSREANDTIVIPENQGRDSAFLNRSPGSISLKDSSGFIPSVPVENGRADAAELQVINREICTCENCNLYLLRRCTVPGRGTAGARLMVVTPPPVDDAREDSMPMSIQGNEYLAKWLTALELNLEQDIFITPAVKCRTPGGRPPESSEVEACNDFLRRQYRAVAPTAVLALGDAACGALSGNPRDFPALVTKNWRWGVIPALVLWTPEEVLAHPERLRRPVWEALLRFKAAWNVLPGTGL